MLKPKRKIPESIRTVYGTSEKSKSKHQARHVTLDSNDPGYTNRVLVATPTAGNVRMEWVSGRYGQIIPMNWSMVTYINFMNSFAPIRYAVPDAQNIIVREALSKDFEWLLLVEDDVILPPDAFVRFNKYMRDCNVPVVSGLYFSRNEPSEPLVFRGRGTSVYWKWKAGQKVWADGVPTGCLLIHNSILKALWKESPEYRIGGGIARRVFDNPQKLWENPETGDFNMLSGTSDLEWCTRVMKDKIFEKAGWKEFQKMKFPFLVDTDIFCKHIDRNTGVQYPPTA